MNVIPIVGGWLAASAAGAAVFAAVNRRGRALDETRARVGGRNIAHDPPAHGHEAA